jgi:NAD(P)-dependent dehydrogenase (short-subunit alcohol dehydrogenase family)
MSTILVTGANRGLGLEFVRQYAAEGWRVHAACRVPGAAVELDELSDQYPEIAVHPLDLGDTESIDRLAEDLTNEKIDVLLNNAGLLGSRAGDETDTQQTFGTIDAASWREVMYVNCIAPVLITQALIDNVARSPQKRIAMVSSGLGSIAGTSGGMYAYRTSKSALNMATATLAKDLARYAISVMAFSPGWVRTDMGGDGAELEAATSVGHLRARIAEMSLADSGGFRSHDGTTIPW